MARVSLFATAVFSAFTRSVSVNVTTFETVLFAPPIVRPPLPVPAQAARNRADVTSAPYTRAIFMSVSFFRDRRTIPLARPENKFGFAVGLRRLFLRRERRLAGGR